MRMLPTLTMFKINMNLEMEGGTDALSRLSRRSPRCPARRCRSTTSTSR